MSIDDEHFIAVLTASFPKTSPNSIQRLDYYKPVMYVEVSGVRTSTLIDTGADLTHISRNFAKTSSSYVKRETYTGPRIQTVNGFDITPRKEFRGIEIANRTLNFKLKHTISILRDQRYDIIVGMNIISVIGLFIIGNPKFFMLYTD